MSLYDNNSFNPCYPMFQSNPEILKLDYEQFNYNQLYDFNSYGFRENSLFNDFSMFSNIEELNEKDNIGLDKVYYIKNPEKNYKENSKELSLEKSNDDSKRKENIEKNNLFTITNKDNFIMFQDNSKNLQELIKEKEFESKDSQTKKTFEQTKLFKEQEKMTKKNSTQFLTKKKKRGPKQKNFDKKRKKNDMFSEYNLSRKFKCDFLNFCVSFSNDLIKTLRIRKKLNNFNRIIIKLNKKFKTTVNKDEDDKLKKATLGEIINNNISSKFKNFDTDHNHKIYDEKLKHNELLKEIFSIKYEILFRIYYQSKRIINLKKCELNNEILEKYDLNEDIKLSSNVKMFNDLLENNTTCRDFLEEKNYDMYNKYKNYLRNCIIKKYMIKAKFLIHEECI